MRESTRSSLAPRADGVAPDSLVAETGGLVHLLSRIRCQAYRPDRMLESKSVPT